MPPLYRQGLETSRVAGSALGAQLQRARLARSMSVELAARNAGLSPETWRCLELGLGGTLGLPTWCAAALAVGADLAVNIITERSRHA